MTRYFWTLFFLGSLLAVALDVRDRHQLIDNQNGLSGEVRTLEADPYSGPTPRP